MECLNPARLQRISERMEIPMSAADLVKLTEDRHQQALYRLAAVQQYLYDTMNGDHDSDRNTPDPLPAMAMDHVREIQRLLFHAIKDGQRTRRECLGGHLELVERPGRWADPVKLVTTPASDPVVQACVDNGGHIYGTARPTYCTRCWFDSEHPGGKYVKTSELRRVRDVPQA